MDWDKWKRKTSKQNYQKERVTEYKNEWRVRLGDWVLGREISMGWEKAWYVQWTKSSLMLLGQKYVWGSCKRWGWKGREGPDCGGFCILY